MPALRAWIYVSGYGGPARDACIGPTINGTNGPDVIQGGPGNETILAGGGEGGMGVGAPDQAEGEGVHAEALLLGEAAREGRADVLGLVHPVRVGRGRHARLRVPGPVVGELVLGIERNDVDAGLRLLRRQLVLELDRGEGADAVVVGLGDLHGDAAAHELELVDQLALVALQLADAGLGHQRLVDRVGQRDAGGPRRAPDGGEREEALVGVGVGGLGEGVEARVEIAERWYPLAVPQQERPDAAPHGLDDPVDQHGREPTRPRRVVARAGPALHGVHIPAYASRVGRPCPRDLPGRQWHAPCSFMRPGDLMTFKKLLAASIFVCIAACADQADDPGVCGDGVLGAGEACDAPDAPGCDDACHLTADTRWTVTRDGGKAPGYPVDVAVGPDGSVYVVDYYKVLKLAPGAAGPIELPFSRFGAINPEYVAVDAAGAVYVTNLGSPGTVVKLAPQ